MSVEVTNGVLKARSVLRELQIRHPSEIVIEAIAFHYGVRLYASSLDGAEACIIRTGRRGTILIRSDLDPGRHRFDIAHELGHFLLHPDLSLKACIEADFLLWSARSAQEREADEFAVNVLLPETLFVQKIRDIAPNFDAIGHIAQDFNTSLTFTVSRYVELCGFQCALVVSSENRIEWFKVSDGFPGWFEKRQRIDPESHAYDVSQGQVSKSGVQPVMATAWFPERRWRDVIIREESIRLGSYGKVLSLIWVPD